MQILREKGDSKQPIYFLSRINSLNSHYSLCLSLEFEMADHDNKQKGSHTKLLCLTFCFNILHVDLKHSFFDKGIEI